MSEECSNEHLDDSVHFFPTQVRLIHNPFVSLNKRPHDLFYAHKVYNKATGIFSGLYCLGIIYIVCRFWHRIRQKTFVLQSSDSSYVDLPDNVQCCYSCALKEQQEFDSRPREF